jgi:hypothetical protein
LIALRFRLGRGTRKDKRLRRLACRARLAVGRGRKTRTEVDVADVIDGAGRFDTCGRSQIRPAVLRAATEQSTNKRGCCAAPHTVQNPPPPKPPHLNTPRRSLPASAHHPILLMQARWPNQKRFRRAPAFTSPARVSVLHFALDGGVCAASARLFAANERPFCNFARRKISSLKIPENDFLRDESE